MGTCCWCTPGGPAAIQILRSYASATSEFSSANDDLCYCLECVDEYHRARDEVPSLHETLWELETSRLIVHFETSLKENGEDDDLYIVEGEKKIPLSCYTGPGFEKHLRVPMLEILKYPYLLLDEHLSNLFVEALCKMEQINYSYQVVGKHPGIYLLMFHPNEEIRRWAILTARNLGKVDRDDYYDIQEVLTCLFKVIELGLFENPDIYSTSMCEKGKLILLPSHLYDTTNYKNYWLGICMLLTVLEEQAMDSLLLGPDKQNDFMQSIMNIMNKQTDDDRSNPFWPALHCFMVILDKLGSKVWGQLIDPIQAFQTIINNDSYKREIENIRQNFRRTKSEPLSDYGDEMITCSQIVYNCHLERPNKEPGWKSSICPDYCPNMYEEMQTLTEMFQYDIGRDMRLHNSTFLWYLPFVHSLMDLKDMGVAYSVVVIHHLCSEIKDVFNNVLLSCDKVSEFYIWILTTVVELNLKKNCLNSLWVSSEKWVEAVVKCAVLPSTIFLRDVERGVTRNSSRNSTTSWEPESVQWACMNVIRNILKEGYQMGQSRTQFLDQLNLLRRTRDDWKLSPQQAQELQECLKHIIRNIRNKSSNPSTHMENTVACVPPAPFTTKQKRQEDRSLVNPHVKSPSCLSPREKEDGQPDTSLPRRHHSLDKEFSHKDPHFYGTSTCYLANIKQEPEKNLKQDRVTSLLANGHMEAQKSGSSHQGLGDSKHTNGFGQGFQGLEAKDVSEKEKKSTAPECLTDNNRRDRLGSATSEMERTMNKLRDNIKSKNSDFTLKLKQLLGTQKRESSALQSGNDGSKGVEEPMGNKLGMNSSFTLHGKPLFIKMESKDRLVEFKSTLKADQNLEDDSSDDDDEMAHIPFSQIRQDLVRKKSTSATASSETDSQIDRELGKLSRVACSKATNFPVDSSQEDSTFCQNHIERKVQGAVRSLSGGETKGKPLSGADKPQNPIIIISDSSSEEEDEKVNVDMKSKKEETGSCPEKQLGAQKQEKALTASNSPSFYAECESQCFEFETEEDIYSAWQDSQMDEKTEEKALPVKASHSPPSYEMELVQQLNDWGYEMDYLGDDVIAKAAGDLEQQVNESKSEPELHIATSKVCVSSSDFTEKRTDGGGCSRHTVPVVSSTSEPSGSSGLMSDFKKHRSRPGKNSTDSLEIKTANKSPGRRNIKPTVPSGKHPPVKPSRSTPAITPPRKVHKFPEPTLVTEKLFLKKKIRRAAELSQRTQDCITRLREYGKTAGELPQKRRAKLIQAQHLSGRNKKMLSCRERHFLSQRRHREREKDHSGNRAAKIAKKADPNPCLQSANRGVAQNQEEKTYPSSHSSSNKRKLIKQSLVGRERDQPSSEPSGIKLPLTRQGSVDSVPKDTTVVQGSLCSLSSGGSRTGSGISTKLGHEVTVLKEGPSKLDENPTSDDENLFLTQLDPVDMELCSQVEGGPGPAGKEGNLPQTPFEKPPLGIEKCKHSGCDEKVSEAGSYCRNHSASDPKSHVFAKPFPPAKASTAKIFSSSSSRSANLTKELENVPRPLAALKNRSNPARPPASDCLRQRNVTSKADPQHQNMNSLSLPASSHSVCSNRTPPMARAAFRPEPQSFFPHSNNVNAQHRDHSIFIKEILKWSYDMFANASQLGPPDHLQRKIVGHVPVKFQDYNDYFNTFFPLTMLNAFEEVAQEWLENRKQKEKRLFRLHLLNYNPGLNKADFTANFSESDLDRQLHPKEDDLVFLKVSEKHSYYEEEEAEDSLIHYVGLVTRFSPPSAHDSKRKEELVLCHLSIQTQGNLSRVNKEVRCVVVSSLVTTQRKFRALLLLNRSLLARPIISPSYGDFCPRDLNVDSERSPSYPKDLNKDQRRAIETAYTMVSQHPELPKICLIHGPPGTGKSKTIVGLLYRMLSERSEKENAVQRLNAKIKRNRVLVCAPSNAAVDDLMKKIILEFKEKCQNKKNVLGNCGDINLVRLGQQRSINKEVRRFSLDDQVNHRMNRAALGRDQGLQKRKEALDQKLDMLSRQRAMDRSEKREKRQQLDEEIGRLVKERQCLGSELKQARGRSQELKASIILESHIICCTLSTSGGVLLESAFRRLGGDPVSCVIVDEAGQTCEIETLIPLIHGCKKLVLVGDPKQLPPTVKSMKAQDYGYDQSLMGRLCRHLKVQVQENQMGRLPVLQLTIQYRMHPDIWLFPAKYIYEATVVTDEKTQENRCSLEWPFQPYMLFDVLDGREEKDSDSYANPQEAKLVIELIKLIKGTRSDIGFRHIGIITPYNAQKRRIRNQLDKDFGENSICEVDTVDGFQGREKDCIIVTCVRANSTHGSIGFLRSLQRLNVTITRAKYSLFIIGKLQTLMESPDWYQLIQDAQKRGNIFKASGSNYKAVAQKILKLKRDTIGHGTAGSSWSKTSHVPRRDGQHPAAKAGPLAQGNDGGRVLPGPPELLSSSSSASSPNPPLPTQPIPVQERPKDPRLARRADVAMAAATTSREGCLSASRGSGMVSPLAPEGPQAFQQPPSSGPVPSFHLPGLVGSAKFFRAQDHDWRIPFATDEAKSLGRGDRQSEELDSRRRSTEESPGLIEAKRRRTTH